MLALWKLQVFKYFLLVWCIYCSIYLHLFYSCHRVSRLLWLPLAFLNSQNRNLREEPLIICHPIKECSGLLKRSVTTHWCFQLWILNRWDDSTQTSTPPSSKLRHIRLWLYKKILKVFSCIEAFYIQINPKIPQHKQFKFVCFWNHLRNSHCAIELLLLDSNVGQHLRLFRRTTHRSF